MWLKDINDYCRTKMKLTCCSDFFCWNPIDLVVAMKGLHLNWLPLLKVKWCLDSKLKCLLQTVKWESKICLPDTSLQGTQLRSKNIGLCNKMSTYCNNNLTLPMYPLACLVISFVFPFLWVWRCPRELCLYFASLLLILP